MFGLLDLNSCGLEKDKRSFYSCNVCNALASRFGRASRLMLTNDSVYLSLLLAGQRSQIPYETLTRPERCRPWSRDSFCKPEFEYPAAVSVLVAGVGLIDNLHDAPSIQSKVHLAVWRSKIREAEQELRELGLKLPSLANLVEEQHRREAVVGRELAYYSGTTEEMYSKIFSHTATLAGAPGNTAHLAEVGRHVGRVAYLLDGYVDFQKDKSEGCFNVFDHLSSSGGSSGNPRQLLAAYANHSLQCIRKNILKVKLRRFQRTIRHTVTEGLWAKVRKTITNPEIIALRPFAYSMLPVAIGLAFRVLQSSSDNGDCCDCSGGTIDCNQMCNDYIQGSIQQALASAVTKTTQGAVAGAAGAGASLLAMRAVDYCTDQASHRKPSPTELSTDERIIGANAGAAILEDTILHGGRAALDHALNPDVAVAEAYAKAKIALQPPQQPPETPSERLKRARAEDAERLKRFFFERDGVV